MSEPSIGTPVFEDNEPTPPEPAARGRGRIMLRTNPVLRRELIERVQGVKVVVFVTIWLALLTGILVLAYQGTVGLNPQFGLDVASLGRVGRELYEWVLFGMLILVLFLVPGLTAGSVTGERERQTLVPLQMTLMRPLDIIFGKLAAALAFLILLVVIAMPLLATSVLIGGVSLLDLARGLGMLLFTGLVLGSVGVAVSSVLKRTTAATVLTYGIALAFAVGSFVGLLVWAIVDGTQGNDEVEPPAQILALNPFAGVADALPRSAAGFDGFEDSRTPFGAMRLAIDSLDDQQRFDNQGLRQDDRGTVVWVWYVLAGVLVMVVSVRRATKSVTTPAETER